MYFRTADVTCQLTFPPEDKDAADKMVMPGDNVEMVCDLVHDTPMELGSRFSLREGGKTIGTGLVSEILVRLPSPSPPPPLALPLRALASKAI